MTRVERDAAGLDVDTIHRWLSTDAYWAMGRPREVVAQSIAHSRCYAAYADGEVDGGVLIGFARVVTDRATYAWICDVYVDRAHRGRGVGQALVDAIHEDLAGFGVSRAMLATGDAHPLYAAHGFTALPDPGLFMVRGYRPGD